MKEGTDPEKPRFLLTINDPLPEDTKLISANIASQGKSIFLVIESASFDISGSKVPQHLPVPSVKAHYLSNKQCPIIPDRNRDSTIAPHPMQIPWHIAELAYSVYVRYGGEQSLNRLAERGGFGASEMDKYLPDWRERVAKYTGSKEETKEPLVEIDGEGNVVPVTTPQKTCTHHWEDLPQESSSVEHDQVCSNCGLERDHEPMEPEEF